MVLMAKCFDDQWKNNFWLWAGWVASYLQRSLSAQMPPWPLKKAIFCGQGLRRLPGNDDLVGCKVPIDLVKISVKEATHIGFYYTMHCVQCTQGKQCTANHVIKDAFSHRRPSRRDGTRGLSKTGQGCVAHCPIKCLHFIRVWFVTRLICNVYDFIHVWFAGQGCVADRPIKCRHFIRVWFVTCMICNVYDFIRVWFATRMVLNTYSF